MNKKENDRSVKKLTDDELKNIVGGAEGAEDGEPTPPYRTECAPRAISPT